MRAFIALELPNRFADDVAAMARPLSAAVEGRFVPRESYHLTLAFLGDIDPALTGLAERLREELAAQGLGFDPKPFRPHLTLARRARLPKGPLPPLVFPEPAEAATATLFKSTLLRDGAQYKPLYAVDLAAR